MFLFISILIGAVPIPEYLTLLQEEKNIKHIKNNEHRAIPLNNTDLKLDLSEDLTCI